MANIGDISVSVSLDTSILDNQIKGLGRRYGGGLGDFKIPVVLNTASFDRQFKQWSDRYRSMGGFDVAVNLKVDDAEIGKIHRRIQSISVPVQVSLASSSIATPSLNFQSDTRELRSSFKDAASDIKLGFKEGVAELSQGIERLKPKNKGLLGSLTDIFTSPFKNAVRGFQEGIGYSYAAQFTAGVTRTVEKTIGTTVEKTGEIFANIGLKVGTKTGKLVARSLGFNEFIEDAEKVREKVNRISSEISDIFNSNLIEERSDKVADSIEKIVASLLNGKSVAKEAFAELNQAFTSLRSAPQEIIQAKRKASANQEVLPRVQTLLSDPDFQKSVPSVQQGKQNVVLAIPGFSTDPKKSADELATNLRKVATQSQDVIPFPIEATKGRNTVTENKVKGVVSYLNKVLDSHLTKYSDATSEAIAKIVAIKLQNPEIQQIDIVGHSLGGAIARELTEAIESLDLGSLLGVSFKGLSLGTATAQTAKPENFTALMGGKDLVAMTPFTGGKATKGVGGVASHELSSGYFGEESQVPDILKTYFETGKAIVPDAEKHKSGLNKIVDKYFYDVADSLVEVLEGTKSIKDVGAEFAPKILPEVAKEVSNTVEKAKNTAATIAQQTGKVSAGLATKAITPALDKFIREAHIRGIEQRAIPLVQQRAEEILSQKTKKNSAKVVTDELESLVITTGGYAGARGLSGARLAKMINAEKLQRQEAIWVKNTDTDIDEEARKQGGSAKARALFTSLAKPNVRGYSKDALEIAAQAVAAKQLNPKIEIKILGESGGGYAAEEAVKILEMMGISGVKGIGVGTPDFIGRLNAQNYKKLISPEEFLGAEAHQVYAPLGFADVSYPEQNIPGITSHPFDEGYHETALVRDFLFNEKQGKVSPENAQEILGAAAQYKQAVQGMGESDPKYIQKMYESVQQNLQKIRQLINQSTGDTLAILKEAESVFSGVEEALFIDPPYIANLKKIEQSAKQIILSNLSNPSRDTSKNFTQIREEIQQIQNTIDVGIKEASGQEKAVLKRLKNSFNFMAGLTKKPISLQQESKPAPLPVDEIYANLNNLLSQGVAKSQDIVEGVEQSIEAIADTLETSPLGDAVNEIALAVKESIANLQQEIQSVGLVEAFNEITQAINLSASQIQQDIAAINIPELFAGIADQIKQAFHTVQEEIASINLAQAINEISQQIEQSGNKVKQEIESINLIGVFIDVSQDIKFFFGKIKKEFESVDLTKLANEIGQQIKTAFMGIQEQVSSIDIASVLNDVTQSLAQTASSLQEEIQATKLATQPSIQSLSEPTIIEPVVPVVEFDISAIAESLNATSKEITHFFNAIQHELQSLNVSESLQGITQSINQSINAIQQEIKSISLAQIFKDIVQAIKKVVKALQAQFQSIDLPSEFLKLTRSIQESAAIIKQSVSAMEIPKPSLHIEQIVETNDISEISQDIASDIQQSISEIAQSIESVELPEKFKEIARQVAKLSNIDIEQLNIPSIQTFGIPSGAKAAYESVTNAVQMSPEFYQELQSATPQSYETTGLAVHELRHAMQTRFGSLSMDDIAKGKFGVELLKPTKDQLKKISALVEQSVQTAKAAGSQLPDSIIQAIEEDAYTFELLYGNSIHESIKAFGNEIINAIESSPTPNVSDAIAQAQQEFEQQQEELSDAIAEQVKEVITAIDPENIKARLAQLQPKVLREIAKDFGAKVSARGRGYLPKSELIGNIMEQASSEQLAPHLPILTAPTEEMAALAKKLVKLPVKEAENSISEIYSSLSERLKAETSVDPKSVKIDQLISLLDEIEETHRLVLTMMSESDGKLLSKLNAYRTNLINLSKTGTSSRLNAEFVQTPTQTIRKGLTHMGGPMQSTGQPLAAVGVVGGVEEAIAQVSQLGEQVNSVAEKIDKPPSDNFFGKLNLTLPNIIKHVKNLGIGFLAFQGLNWLQSWFSSVSTQTFEVTKRFQTLEKTIAFISGGKTQGADTMKFLRSEVDRVSGSLQPAIEGYKTVAASSRGTRLEGESTREIFSAVNQAGAVYGLTNEQTEGSLLAISQMISKGVISAEELRGQLSERIPGALQIMARSLNVTEKELGGLLESGSLVASEVLPKFARQLSMETAGGVAGAAQTAQGAVNKFNNSITELQIGIGKQLAPIQVTGLNVLSSAIKAIADNGEIVGQVLMVFGSVLLGVVAKALWTVLVNSIAARGGIMALGLAAGVATKALGVFILQTVAITAAFEAAKIAINLFSIAIGQNDITEWANKTEEGLNKVRAAREALNESSNKQPEFKPPSVNWADDLMTKYSKLEGWQKIFFGPLPAIGEAINRTGNLIQGEGFNYTSWADMAADKRREAYADQSIRLGKLSQNGTDLISGFTGNKMPLADAIRQAKETGKAPGSGQLAEIFSLDKQIEQLQLKRMALPKNATKEQIAAIQGPIDDLIRKRGEKIKVLQETQGQLTNAIQELKTRAKSEADPQIKAGMEADAAALEKVQAQLNKIEQATGATDEIKRFAQAMRELGIQIAEASRESQIFLTNQNRLSTEKAIKGFASDPLAGRTLARERLENQGTALKQEIDKQRKAIAEFDKEMQGGRNRALLEGAGIDENTSVDRMRSIAEQTTDADAKKAIEAAVNIKEAKEKLAQSEGQLAENSLQIRQQVEQDALYAIQQGAAKAEAATRNKENARVSIVKWQQKNRVLSEEQVAESLARIQLDTVKQNVVATNQEIAELDKKHKQGLISAEQYNDRRRELGTKASDQQRQLIEQELAVQEAVNRRKIADVDFTNRQQEAKIEASLARRINKIKSLQASGQLSERQAQTQITREQGTSIGQQISETKNQQVRDRRLFEQQAISPREYANRQIQTNQKLAQLEQQRSENRLQQTQQALQELEFYNRRAEQIVEVSQQTRLNTIKQKQAQGRLSERQASIESTQIQQQEINKRLALAKQELQQVNQSTLLSPEDKVTKQLEINQKIASLNQQRLDAEIQANQQEIQQIEFFNRRAEQLTELSQQRRLNIVKQRQVSGQLSERQSAIANTQIQQEEIAKRIALTQRELQQVGESTALSPEDKTSKQIELNQKLANLQQQQLDAQNQANQQALQQLEFYNRRAEQAVELSQQARLNAVKKAQADGQLSERQAQELNTQIQSESINQQIALIQEQIQQTKQLKAQGKLSAEDATSKEIELNQKLAQVTGQRIDNEIAQLQNLRNAIAQTIQMREAEIELQSSRRELGIATREASAIEITGTISPLRQAGFEKERLLSTRAALQERRDLTQGRLDNLSQERLSPEEEKRTRTELQQQLTRIDIDFQQNRKAIAQNEYEQRQKLLELGIADASAANTRMAAEQKRAMAEQMAAMAEASGGVVDPLLKLQAERKALQAEQNTLFRQIELNKRKLAELPQRGLGAEEGAERDRLLEERAGIYTQIAGNRQALAENVASVRERRREVELAQLELAASSRSLELQNQELAMLRSGLPYNQEQVRLEQEKNRLVSERESLLAKQKYAGERLADLGANAPQDERIKRQQAYNEATAAVNTNEQSLIKATRDLALNSIEQRIAAEKRRAETAIAGLDREKTANDQISKRLDLQNQLLRSRQDLSKAVSDASITYGQIQVDAISKQLDARRRLDTEEDLDPGVRNVLQGIAGSDSEERLLERKHQLEREIAQRRLEAIKTEHAFAKANLEIDLQRNRLANQNAVLEAQSAQLNAQKGLNEAQAGLDKAAKSGDTEAIAEAQKNRDLAVQQIELANTGLAIAQEGVAAQAELADNARKAMEAQQGAALAQEQANSAAQGQSQALEKAEAAARKSANKKAGGGGGSGASMSLVLTGDNIAKYHEARARFEKDLQSGGRQTVLQNLTGIAGDDKFYAYAAQQSGMGDLLKLADSLRNTFNPIEIGRAINEGNVGNMSRTGDVVSELRSLNDNVSRLANRPSVGTLQVSSANPVGDAAGIMSDMSRNSLRGMN